MHLLQVIQEELLPCLEVATSGLLAVLLRGLACGSAAFRSCSCEALALYTEALKHSNFRWIVCLASLAAYAHLPPIKQRVLCISDDCLHRASGCVGIL